MLEVTCMPVSISLVFSTLVNLFTLILGSEYCMIHNKINLSQQFSLAIGAYWRVALTRCDSFLGWDFTMFMNESNW